MRFKVGDKVRVIDTTPFYEIENGTLGEITDLIPATFTGLEAITITFDERNSTQYLFTTLADECIALVEEPKIEKDDLYTRLDRLINRAFRFTELNNNLKDLLDTDEDLERYHTSTQTTYNEYILYGEEYDLVILTLPTMDGGIHIVDYVVLG